MSSARAEGSPIEAIARERDEARRSQERKEGVPHGALHTPIMLQPGEGGGQSVASLQGFEQCGPLAGKSSHEVPAGHCGLPGAVLHGDMKTRPPSRLRRPREAPPPTPASGRYGARIEIAVARSVARRRVRIADDEAGAAVLARAPRRRPRASSSRRRCPRRTRPPPVGLGSPRHARSRPRRSPRCCFQALGPASARNRCNLGSTADSPTISGIDRSRAVRWSSAHPALPG